MVLLVGFIGSVTYYGVCQYQRLNTSFLDKYDLEKVSEYQSVENVYPLLYSRDIFTAWYRAIIDAKERIRISTYTWKMSELKEGSGLYTTQMVILGGALKVLDESLNGTGKRIPVHIVGNRSLVMVSNETIMLAIDRTKYIWQQMGLKFVNLDLEVRLWKHVGINNIHTKILVVDDTHYVCSSMNFESPSSGQKYSWIDSGIYLHEDNGLPYKKKMLEHFEYLWKGSVKVDMITIPDIPDMNFRPFCLDENDKELTPYEFVNRRLEKIDNVKCLPLFVGAGKLLPTDTYRENEIMDELLKRLKSAEKNIRILTPRVNDPTILNILKEKADNGISVRVVSDYPYNESVLTHIAGYKNNKIVFNDKKYSNIEFRYYTNYKGGPTQGDGQSCERVHTKLYTVDDKWCMIGSLNCDVFATLGSTEAMVACDDERCTSSNLSLFRQIWSKRSSDELLNK